MLSHHCRFDDRIGAIAIRRMWICAKLVVLFLLMRDFGRVQRGLGRVSNSTAARFRKGLFNDNRHEPPSSHICTTLSLASAASGGVPAWRNRSLAYSRDSADRERREIRRLDQFSASRREAARRQWQREKRRISLRSQQRPDSRTDQGGRAAYCSPGPGCCVAQQTSAWPATKAGPPAKSEWTISATVVDDGKYIQDFKLKD